MKWRKLNRALHRDLGYLFFGMTIIYAVSGIVLNHKTSAGDASIVSRSESFEVSPTKKENIDKEYVNDLLDQLDEDAYKSHYFPASGKLTIYLKQGHIAVNLESGQGQITKIRKRPILTEFNFLHYNKPKKLWTWFSDIYAISLLILAITGLFILRGKNSIARRGAFLTLTGLLIPIVFLFMYLW